MSQTVDSSVSASAARDAAKPRPSLKWRVVDIVVAAVLAVAVGLIFLVWNQVGGPWFGVMNTITPGFGGIANGVWLIGGVIGGLVIRKPGAAFFVEFVASAVSAALGSQWGPDTMISGFAQGLGAELIFAIFAYRYFNIWVAMLAGLGAGLGAIVKEYIQANHAMTIEFNVIYLIATSLSGIILAGLLGWLLVKALAQTGVLSQFAIGRERRGTA